MHIIAFLLFIAVAILVGVFVVAAIVVKRTKDILSSFTRKGRAGSGSHSRHAGASGKAQGRPGKSKKLFDDDEGEYVEFEEIK